MFGFGKKKQQKASWTMVMQVANAHSFSIGFVGIQLTHGYVAALTLSSICVIVGMIVSLIPDFHGSLGAAIMAGVPLGIVVAFVYDSMTVFGLKMVRESKQFKRFFAVVLTAGGIILSTMAGDTMWGLVYHDIRSLILAASVSCMIIAVEVWAKEHTAAVEHASQSNTAMQTALNTEVEVIVDKMLRNHTHSMLKSPEMQEDLRQQSETSVRQIVQAKFKSRLSSFGGGVSVAASDETVQIPEVAESVSEQSTGNARSAYGEHREAIISALEANPNVSINELVRLTGRPRATVARWQAKAKRELGIDQDEDEGEVSQDGDEVEVLNGQLVR